MKKIIIIVCQKQIYQEYIFFYHALSHYTVYGVTIKTTIASSERTVQCSNYKTYSATRVQINNKKRTIVTHKVTLVIFITNVKKNVCLEP